VDRLEKLPHGVGIMLDDIAAGIFAGLILLAVEKVLNLG
jgi:phosphatidylglycerophosphatase A